jgi:hypothetical protein
MLNAFFFWLFFVGICDNLNVNLDYKNEKRVKIRTLVGNFSCFFAHYEVIDSKCLI